MLSGKKGIHRALAHFTLIRHSVFLRRLCYCKQLLLHSSIADVACNTVEYYSFSSLSPYIGKDLAILILLGKVFAGTINC